MPNKSQRLTKKQKIFITIAFIIGIVLFFVILSIATLGNNKTESSAKLEEKKASVSTPADANHEANEYRSRFKNSSATSNVQQVKQTVDTSTEKASQTHPQQTVSQSSTARDQFVENLLRMKQQAYLEALNSDTSVKEVANVFPSDRADIHTGSTNDISSIADRIAEASDNGELRANMQKTKEKFVTTQRTFGYATQGREAPLTKSEIKTGTILPAVLLTEINSDLPGLITAQITENIRDSLTGKTILVPKGSKLIGSYDSQVAMGQERVLIAWNRVQFPDTSTLELGNMGGIDGLGQAGFNDQVDNHYRRIFGNATLLAIIGAGFQLSQPDRDNSNNNRGMTAREQMIAELGKQWSNVGSEMIRRNLNIQPTLHIRAGYKFNVLVNKDLILPEYQ